MRDGGSFMTAKAGFRGPMIAISGRNRTTIASLNTEMGQDQAGKAERDRSARHMRDWASRPETASRPTRGTLPRTPSHICPV